MSQKNVIEQLLFFQHCEIEAKEEIDKSGTLVTSLRILSKKKDGSVGIHKCNMGKNIDTSSPMMLKVSTMFLVHKIKDAIETVKKMDDEPLSFYYSEFITSKKGDYLLTIRSVLIDDSPVCTRIHNIETKGSSVSENGLICSEYVYDEVNDLDDMIN